MPYCSSLLGRNRLITTPLTNDTNHTLYTLRAPWNSQASIIYPIDSPAELTLAAKEIGGVFRALTHGNAEQQETALSRYFLPNATFDYPRGRTPSHKRTSSSTFSCGVEFLWLVIAIYQWYCTLSPHLDIKVDKVGQYLELSMAN